MYTNFYQFFVNLLISGNIVAVGRARKEEGLDKAQAFSAVASSGNSLPSSVASSGNSPSSVATSEGYPSNVATSRNYPSNVATSGNYPSNVATTRSYPSSVASSGGYPSSVATSGNSRPSSVASLADDISTRHEDRERPVSVACVFASRLSALYPCCALFCLGYCFTFLSALPNLKCKLFLYPGRVNFISRPRFVFMSSRKCKFYFVSLLCTFCLSCCLTFCHLCRNRNIN